MEMKEMKIDDLTPAYYNPRKELGPEDAEYIKLKRSIENFGYVDPVIYNKQTGTVVGGHQRLKVLKDLGYESIMVSVIDVSEEQEKALNLALNKIDGEWDNALLKDLLEELDTGDFDMDLTGFDFEEIEDLMTQFHVDDEEEMEAEEKETLIERFIVPPFSVLDTRQGYWQERKRSWLNLGIKSEVGRGADDSLTEDGLTFSVNSQPPGVYDEKKEYEKKIGYEITMQEFAKRFPDKIQLSGTSIFDPVLCEIAYRWFNIPKGKVIDPFAGGSVRGIVASKLEQQYLGVDLSERQIKANKKQGEDILTEDDPFPIWVNGDSKEIDIHAEGYKADLIFSCPPYADLEVYSDDPRDISNMDYDSFIETYREIIKKTCNQLEDNRFAVFVVGEVRDKNGFYYNFVADTIQAFLDAGMQYYNEMILVNVAGSLPMRSKKYFNSSRKIGKSHQNVLVFYKGDTKKIKENFPELEIDELFKEHDAEYGEEL